jgi:hypothetical protein
MGFYGREALLSLIDQLVQTGGGSLVPATGYRPILVVEGCGGSGRTSFLEFVTRRWAARVPTAGVMHPLGYESGKSKDKGRVKTAVQALLPEIMLDFGGEVPGYRMSFRRLTLAYIAMQEPVKATEATAAKQEMQERLARYRGARLSQFLSETLQYAAVAMPPPGTPGLPPVDLPAVAEHTAGLLTARLQRSRFLARIDWGAALMWFAPDDKHDVDAAVTTLVALSRQASHPASADKRRVDTLLLRALLEDLREGVAAIPQRPGNCLLLLDDADTAVGQEFLTTLADTRMEQAQRGMAPDPLTVVACGSDIRSIGRAGAKPQRTVEDLTVSDFGRTAVWLRIGLADLSPLDVHEMITEHLREAEGLDSAVVEHMVYRLTGGHALATEHVLTKLELDPPLIDDMNKLLAGPGPEGAGSLEHYLLQKIILSLSSRRRNIPLFWGDLAITSAARYRDEAGYLTTLFKTAPDDKRALLSDSLWSHERPDGRLGMVPTVRYLLLRELARRGWWDNAFGLLCGPEEQDSDPEKDEAPAGPADPAAAPVVAAESKDQLAGCLHRDLALGEVADVVGELTGQLTASAKKMDIAAAAGWLELLDAVVATPDLRDAAHGQSPARLSRQQAATQNQPTASVLGLATGLWRVADPCAYSRELLREHYMAISHHYGQLVDHLPAGAILMLDRAKHYRDLAKAIA